MTIADLNQTRGLGTIVVDGVWTRFSDADLWVHQGITFEVEPGECFVVIGGSGAGKSVLVKLLIGLLAPERGKVLVDGVDVAHASEDDVYRTMKRIGVAFGMSESRVCQIHTAILRRLRRRIQTGRLVV